MDVEEITGILVAAPQILMNYILLGFAVSEYRAHEVTETGHKGEATTVIVCVAIASMM